MTFPISYVQDYPKYVPGSIVPHGQKNPSPQLDLTHQAGDVDFFQHMITDKSYPHFPHSSAKGKQK